MILVKDVIIIKIEGAKVRTVSRNSISKPLSGSPVGPVPSNRIPKFIGVSTWAKELDAKISIIHDIKIKQKQIFSFNFFFNKTNPDLIPYNFLISLTNP